MATCLFPSSLMPGNIPSRAVFRVSCPTSSGAPTFRPNLSVQLCLFPTTLSPRSRSGEPARRTQPLERLAPHISAFYLARVLCWHHAQTVPSSSSSCRLQHSATSHIPSNVGYARASVVDRCGLLRFSHRRLSTSFRPSLQILVAWKHDTSAPFLTFPNDRHGARPSGHLGQGRVLLYNTVVSTEIGLLPPNPNSRHINCIPPRLFRIHRKRSRLSFYISQRVEYHIVWEVDPRFGSDCVSSTSERRRRRRRPIFLQHFCRRMTFSENTSGEVRSLQGWRGAEVICRKSVDRTGLDPGASGGQAGVGQHGQARRSGMRTRWSAVRHLQQDADTPNVAGIETKGRLAVASGDARATARPMKEATRPARRRRQRGRRASWLRRWHWWKKWSRIQLLLGKGTTVGPGPQECRRTKCVLWSRVAFCSCLSVRK